VVFNATSAMENTNINENINSEIIIHMNIQNQVRKNTSA
jgi:hypothetical protein